MAYEEVGLNRFTEPTGPSCWNHIPGIWGARLMWQDIEGRKTDIFCHHLQDTVAVDSRFQVLAAVDCPNLGRTKGNWYKAVPPLARCYTGLTPGDYFGRAMVANLPSNVRVGIINVAVGGCRIELFDKDNYQSYVETSPDWLKNMVKEYGGNPYARLVEMAKLAQKDGVIKGILLHQGESNTNDKDWPLKVKGVYDNLLNDLGLSAANVPLLAGEVVHADQNGVCASMNTIIDSLPQVIPTAHVIYLLPVVRLHPISFSCKMKIIECSRTTGRRYHVCSRNHLWQAVDDCIHAGTNAILICMYHLTCQQRHISGR